MIEIKRLSLRLGSFSLKDINLTIEDREYFVILGHTGAGKTILLECIAGLHNIKQGEIWMDGTEITHLPPGGEVHWLRAPGLRPVSLLKCEG